MDLAIARREARAFSGFGIAADTAAATENVFDAMPNTARAAFAEATASQGAACHPLRMSFGWQPKRTG
jgi:hypothetical protein